MLDFSNTGQLMDAIFLELSQGVGQPDHPFWLCSLATIGRTQRPQTRMVVNRGINQSLRQLTVYADRRSPKIAEIEANPFVNILFYHHSNRVQIRCHATATVHVENDLCLAAWANLPASSQAMYAAATGPSGVLSSSSSERVINAIDNFTVIQCEIEAIDVLQLDRTSNQRALLEWTGSGWQKTAIAP